MILAMVSGEGARVGVMGIVIGVLGAAGLSRLVAHRLLGVTPLEPAVYGVAAGLPLILVVIASVILAYRGTRVDPMVALRAE
jgi:ABC-type antimicrobial peptide transport system permease subunit